MTRSAAGDAAPRVCRATPAHRGWVDAAHDSVGFPRSGVDDDVWVAVVGDLPIAAGRLVPQGDGSVELGGIYVDPGHRGAGVAAAVVAALLAAAGPRTVWCLPLTPLVPWYHRFGFAAASPEGAPAAVRAKLAWCRATFPEGVALLRRA